MRKKLLICAAVTFATLVVVLAPIPLPPDRIQSEEPSPDGTLVARYSWRPSGLMGLIGHDNPWVYLTVVDVKSGLTVERHKTWGDVPSDAHDRLAHLVTWRNHEGHTSAQ